MQKQVLEIIKINEMSLMTEKRQFQITDFLKLQYFFILSLHFTQNVGFYHPLFSRCVLSKHLL